MKLPHPRLPSFDYIRADNIEQVTALLLNRAHEVCLFMGGTDVFVQMRNGWIEPLTMVDVKHLPGMTDIKFDPTNGISLGAAVNMNALTRHPAVKKHYPLLLEAINTIASYQLRTRATVGGNLCNASPAADTAPAVLVLEADLIAMGPNGARTIPAPEFFLNPGENSLQPGEILTRIDIPIPPKGWKGRYLKLGRNTAGDLAIVGVAVMGYPDETTGSKYRFRIALASVAPTPIRVLKAEEILAQGPINEEIIKLAAKAAQVTCKPIDDVRASARYRKDMVRVFTKRGLRDVWAMLQEEA